MTFRQFTPSIYGIMCIRDNSSRKKMKKAQHGRRQHIYSISHVWDGVLFVFSILFSLCVYVYIFILTKQKVFHFLRIFARHWNLEWHKCVQPYTTLFVCLCMFITEKLLKRPTFCCVTILRLWAWLTDWQLSLSSLCNLNYNGLDRVPLKRSHLTK